MELDDYRKHENRARARRWGFVFPDVRVVSFPRSGRSWIKFMSQHVMLASGRRFQRKEGLAMFKHDGAGIHRANRRKYYEPDKRRLYKNKRVALVVREPLDVVVSSYHLLRNRLKQPRMKQWTVDEYVMQPRGLPFLVEWMNDWGAQVHVPKAFEVFQYESFLEDPSTELSRFVDWVGLKNVPQERIDNAVKAFSFDNMRRHDEKHLLPGIEQEIEQSLDPSDSSSFAVRRGVAGGWQQELRVETKEWAINHLRQNLHPYWEQYKETDYGGVMA